ncbi:Nuclear RNA export factor 1 [Operophtera brumata]|uniref:Nuclear RNA export factor 1 n=1 Tax=Operophtera brumata TaxID=104452 RepID=A0A0L7LPS3_OPEBR|nr:Nuclear RNA export factor 1 [Operophtera brumata]
MDEGDMECVVGPSAIAKEYTTIVRIGGIVKITAESLADEEHLLSFTRTLVLNTRDGSVYKIANELLYWDIPDKVYAETAFKITRVS